jgi:hypothetical protein
MECRRNSNYVRLSKKSCVESTESPFGFFFSSYPFFLLKQCVRFPSLYQWNSIFLLPITSNAFPCLFTFVVLHIVSTIASRVLVEGSPFCPFLYLFDRVFVSIVKANYPNLSSTFPLVILQRTIVSIVKDHGAINGFQRNRRST